MNPIRKPIAHIVIWRLNGQDLPEKTAQAVQIKQAFKVLKNQIPGLTQLEVGHNIVENSDAWDIAAYMVFESLESLVEYQSHPAHIEIKKLVGPMRLDRCQVDFELSDF